MKLWRITTRKYALDKSCYGARTEGGRWNPIGFAVMYAGTTIEICALEKFVHLGGAMHPPLVLVSIALPDEPGLIIQPELATLPPNWAELPAPESTQIFGRDTLLGTNALALLLPSAIIPEASNVVIHAEHPAFSRVTLKIERDFAFDARMLS